MLRARANPRTDPQDLADLAAGFGYFASVDFVGTYSSGLLEVVGYLEMVA